MRTHASKIWHSSLYFISIHLTSNSIHQLTTTSLNTLPYLQPCLSMKEVEQLLMDQSSVTNHVHILLVSFPGQGHVNPLLRLAKRMAAKGPLVTFSSSTDIGAKISSSTNTTPGVAVPVGRGHLRLEFFPDGWAPDDPRRLNIGDFMAHIHDSWPSAVADLIRHQDPPITAVVSNPFVPRVLDVAVDMGIPSAVLWVQSVAVFSTYYHFHHDLVPFPTADCPDTAVALPGLPPLQPDELPTFLLPSNPFPSLRDAILEQFKTLHKASWVFANTFEELERDAISAMSELVPVIPVGPLVGTGEAGPSGDFWKAADCMEWLDAQEKQSVVYVSVGSVVVLSKEETAEVAYGLLLAGRPFIWVVREDCRNLLPEGFLEECGEKGMVVGWAPQESVLAHAAVGCFVTHCGWNSTLEALAAGMPVVAFPQWGDQVTDAKFLVDVYGVGVWMKGEVGREKVRKCVEEVMVGEETRRRATEWRVAARAAVAEGGLSDRHVDAFVNEIGARRRGCGEGVGKLATAT